MTVRNHILRIVRRSAAAALTAAAAAVLLSATACHSIDDDSRIPSMPVSIDISSTGAWNTWGVAGFGLFRYFIIAERLREPADFPFPYGSCTGFGGVLLIGGMDPFSGDTGVPLAYDLACPVERDPDVRVAIDIQSFEAVCPDCHSHYDVTMAGGAPTAGPALTGKTKYSLKRYRCLPAPLGGYTITN